MDRLNSDLFNVICICVKNVRKHAISNAQQHLTRSHAYSFVIYVVKSVCVCHRERMDIKKNVLVIITGKTRTVDQNVHNIKNKTENMLMFFSLKYLCT